MSMFMSMFMRGLVSTSSKVGVESASLLKNQDNGPQQAAEPANYGSVTAESKNQEILESFKSKGIPDGLFKEFMKEPHKFITFTRKTVWKDHYKTATSDDSPADNIGIKFQFELPIRNGRIKRVKDGVLKDIKDNVKNTKTITWISANDVKMNSKFLEDYEQLTHLDFSWSNLSSANHLPKNLEVLSLRSVSTLTDSLAAEIFLPELQVLDISYTPLTSKGVQRLLDNCPKLEVLIFDGEPSRFFSNNKLTGSYGNLRVLKVNSNSRIQMFDNLDCFPELQFLDLSYSKLTESNLLGIKNLQNLSALNLAHTKCPSLWFASSNDSKITVDTFKPAKSSNSSHSPFEALEYLDISNSDINVPVGYEIMKREWIGDYHDKVSHPIKVLAITKKEVQSGDLDSEEGIHSSNSDALNSAEAIVRSIGARLNNSCEIRYTDYKLISKNSSY